MLLANADILKIKILQASYSKDWDIARKEWEVLEVYISETPRKCLCGHFPIRRICELVNRVTGSIETVGSCCVTNFLDFKPELLYNSLQRIKEKPAVMLKNELIELAYRVKIISALEYGTYRKLRGRKGINEQGKALIAAVNSRILDYFSND